MSQLDLFSNQLPANVADAIAWATKKGDRLVISFKMETPIWIEDKSLVQWLQSIADIVNHGLDGSNYAIELINAPSWLMAEMKKYKSNLGGSSHPINEVEWSK